MTVTNETNDATYTAAGTVNEAFPTVFRFFDSSDVIVMANGVLQIEGTNYTVFGGSGIAGFVRWEGSPTTGHTIVLTRRRPATQTHNYLENDSFPAETHEATVDKIAMATAARMGLLIVDPRKWDAASKIVANVTDPTAAQDAATKAYVDSLVLTGVALPTPLDPADDDKFLRANAAITSWQFPPFAVTDLPAGGDTGRVLTATGAGTFDWQAVPSTAPAPQNLIINPDGDIFQRMGQANTMTAANTLYPNNDAQYAWDRWVLLSDGDDTVDLTRETGPGFTPPGSPASMRFDVQTIDRKFGICQFLTFDDSRRLHESVASRTATLQFKAYTPTANPLRNLRCAILAWTNGSDNPTRDVISAWNVEGTNPTFAANYTTEGISANLVLVVDTWTTFTLTVTLATGATTDNLVVVIWLDDDDAALGDLLFISDVMLETGSVAQSFVRRPHAVELAACQAFFVSTFGPDEEPRDPIAFQALVHAWVGATLGNFRTNWYFPVPMWRGPNAGRAIILVNPGGGAANNARNLIDSVDVPVSTAMSRVRVQFTDNVPAAGNANDEITVGAVVENELGY